VRSDIHFLVIEQHAIDGLDSIISGLASLVVDETIALGAAMLVGRDFAREHVSEGGEGVVESLVVDGLVEVLNKDVALTGLAEGRVTLRPHNTARTGLSALTAK